MKVSVHLHTQAEPVHYPSVVNAYQKGDLYCVMVSAAEVHKFPLAHVFRIVEDGTDSAQCTWGHGMLGPCVLRSGTLVSTYAQCRGSGSGEPRRKTHAARVNIPANSIAIDADHLSAEHGRLNDERRTRQPKRRWYL
jgi:hypothetical protein